MNRALLAELQRHRHYPSITILLNTTSGAVPTAAEVATAHHLVDEAARRLADDPNAQGAPDLVGTLRALIDEHREAPAAHALALCASPAYATGVRLGRPVQQRVVIDDSFATRDLVADLNRTALYRVITVSDRTIRLFAGDRQRLVEERTDTWPLHRDPDASATTWNRDVATRLRDEHARAPLPTVLAGVERSVRHVAAAVDPFATIGFIAGNHDRTSWIDLHHAAWPLVTDWLRTDRVRALQRLEHARSARRYAGGIGEVWPLANEGRVDLVVVEEHHIVPARIDEHQQLLPADDPDAPDVVDDVVDETIEAVLRHGGSCVVMGDGDLADHDRIAAILRY